MSNAINSLSDAILQGLNPYIEELVISGGCIYLTMYTGGDVEDAMLFISEYEDKLDMAKRFNITRKGRVLQINI